MGSFILIFFVVVVVCVCLCLCRYMCLLLKRKTVFSSIAIGYKLIFQYHLLFIIGYLDYECIEMKLMLTVFRWNIEIRQRFGGDGDGAAAVVTQRSNIRHY